MKDDKEVTKHTRKGALSLQVEKMTHVKKSVLGTRQNRMKLYIRGIKISVLYLNYIQRVRDAGMRLSQREREGPDSEKITYIICQGVWIVSYKGAAGHTMEVLT